MDRSEVLEQLYAKLPDKRADELIDLVLSDESYIAEAEDYLLNGDEPQEQINIFAAIKGKPLYKNTLKFMEDETENVYVIMKMLSSIITQILIQCELRENKTPYNILDKLTKLLLEISKEGDFISADLKEEIKSEIYFLGWESPTIERQGEELDDEFSR